MYFVNDSHEQNFNKLLKIFNRDNDCEYTVLAYVYALPNIYRRCVNDPMFKEFPFAWKFDYENTSYVENDDGEEYTVFDFKVKTDENNNPLMSENYDYLSSSYKRVINLAENLFNGSVDDFNLATSLNIWDDNLIKVFYQALSIRLFYGQKIVGLNIEIE